MLGLGGVSVEGKLLLTTVFGLAGLLVPVEAAVAFAFLLACLALVEVGFISASWPFVGNFAVFVLLRVFLTVAA